MLNAQNFQLKVVSENAPLPYAYVYINGRIFCSADSLGIAFIPVSSLKLGDTLSSSFIGADNNFVIYDNDMAIKGMQTIILKENLSLDGVIVLANDKSKEYFRKYVNTRYVPTWFDELRGSFSMELSASGGVEKIQGVVIASSIPKETYSSEKSILISTKSDTVGQSRFLRQRLTVIKLARDGVNFSKSVVYNKGIIYKYMGENNGKRVFFITRPLLTNEPSNSESFQTLLCVDKETKDITSAETYLILNNGKVIYNIDSDYQVDKKTNTIFPTKLNVVLTVEKESKKSIDKIEINNISLQIHKRSNK